jgi:uncharacterized protein (DUF433 family)
MTVTLNLNAEVEKGLQTRARARGLSLDEYLQEVVAGRTGSLDWSQCPAVESVPGKVSGAWVLKGTRMPVSAIFENLEAGASIDDIMEWYDGLDREQVKAVIEFAVRSLDTPPALASH